jgi:predicted DNA-binding transcriptional regulator AlpA
MNLYDEFSKVGSILNKDKILFPFEVMNITKKSIVELTELVLQAKFPFPVRKEGDVVGWKALEVSAWLSAKEASNV